MLSKIIINLIFQTLFPIDVIIRKTIPWCVFFSFRIALKFENINWNEPKSRKKNILNLSVKIKKNQFNDLKCSKQDVISVSGLFHLEFENNKSSTSLKVEFLPRSSKAFLVLWTCLVFVLLRWSITIIFEFSATGVANWCVIKHLQIHPLS